MEETKRKYWEKEAIRISEMLHRGFYEKDHPSQGFGWLTCHRKASAGSAP